MTRFHGEHDAPVADEDLGARLDVLGELLVAHGDVTLVTEKRVVGVQGHLPARLDQDGLAVLQHPGANLGALRVQQHRAHQARVQHGLPQRIQRALVVLVRAVREVEAGHGHARAEQVLHDGQLRGLGAERAHDLRGARGIVSFAHSDVISGAARTRRAPRETGDAPWSCTAPRACPRGYPPLGCSPCRPRRVRLLPRAPVV